MSRFVMPSQECLQMSYRLASPIGTISIGLYGTRFQSGCEAIAEAGRVQHDLVLIWRSFSARLGLAQVRRLTTSP